MPLMFCYDNISNPSVDHMLFNMWKGELDILKPSDLAVPLQQDRDPPVTVN